MAKAAMRRPSKEVSDLMAPDARNSPMSHGDDGHSTGRRKSVFPPVKAAVKAAQVAHKRGRRKSNAHSHNSKESENQEETSLPAQCNMNRRKSSWMTGKRKLSVVSSWWRNKNLEEREKSGVHIPANLEPTYRMEPHRKFFAPQVHTMLKQILEAHLDDFKYNPKFVPTMTKVLSDEIKERSKALNFERYKLVVCVVIGERRDQGLMISSRAAWDAKLDSYATYTFQNKTIFCTASVYGVYAE